MKHIKSGWISWVIPPLAGMIIFVFGGISLAQAEPPLRLSPGDVLSGFLSSTIGALSPSSASIKVQAECSHELEQCWES